MVKRIRQLLPAIITIVLFAVAGIGLASQRANAEGDNQFPGITGNATNWTTSPRSPDPELSWKYRNGNNNDHISGETRHILRNTSAGRNESTNLRLYYGRVQPAEVSVRVNVVSCRLEATGGYAGEVRVSLGGKLVYHQETMAPEKESRWIVNRDWVIQSKAKGGSHYKDGSQYFAAAKDGRLANSPVCENNAAYTVPVYKKVEDCGDWNEDGDNCQKAAGTYSAPELTNRGPHPVAGTNNKLDQRTFTLAWGELKPAKKGYDSNLERWYVDFDVELDAEKDAKDDQRATAGMKQRISFKVIAENTTDINASIVRPSVGYRSEGTEQNRWRHFGLVGGGEDDGMQSSYGQKYALPFGLPCGNDVQSPQAGRIIVYDPDINSFGDVYMKVLRRDPESRQVSELNINEYTNRLNAVPGGIGLRADVQGSDKTSAFTIQMEKEWQYMLVIVNPKVEGKSSPTGNVYSVYLPTDSINGLTDCKYNLDPNTTGVKSTFSAYGDTISVTGSVTKTREESVAGEHDWRIIKAVFDHRPADLSRTTDVDSTDPPCAFVATRSGGYRECVPNFHQGTYSGNVEKTINDSVSPQDLGTYVCYMTAVKGPAWNVSSNVWRYSSMMCSVAGIKPKIQVWGGDLKVEKGIITSQDTLDGKTYGSWGEYGVMSNCINNGMASGAGLNGGSMDVDKQNMLTFANTPSLGCFGVTAQSPNVRSTITSPLAYVRHFETSRTYGRNTNQVYDLRNHGTITIGGDQVYGGEPYRKIGEIPRVIILADSFRIANNVRRIDPWLVATGSIETCAEVDIRDPLSSRTCGNNLTFNGPVYANQVYLYRTAGSRLSSLNEPAELFNLRADAYLSAIAGNSDTSVATTDSVIELPPRF